MRRQLVLCMAILLLSGCAFLQKYGPDSYEHPDGKYKATCVKDVKACTQTCNADVDGHIVKKTYALEDCVVSK